MKGIGSLRGYPDSNPKPLGPKPPSRAGEALAAGRASPLLQQAANDFEPRVGALLIDARLNEWMEGWLKVMLEW